jgi:hypothetical protein
MPPLTYANSSRKYATSGKLSRTEPGIFRFFLRFLFFFVFRPPLAEWLFARGPFENSARAFARFLDFDSERHVVILFVDFDD